MLPYSDSTGLHIIEIVSLLLLTIYFTSSIHGRNIKRCSSAYHSNISQEYSVLVSSVKGSFIKVISLTWNITLYDMQDSGLFRHWDSGQSNLDHCGNRIDNFSVIRNHPDSLESKFPPEIPLPPDLQKIDLQRLEPERSSFMASHDDFNFTLFNYSKHFDDLAETDTESVIQRTPFDTPNEREIMNLEIANTESPAASYSQHYFCDLDTEDLSTIDTELPSHEDISDNFVNSVAEVSEVHSLSSIENR